MIHECPSALTAQFTPPMVAHLVDQTLQQLCQGNPVLITPLASGSLKLEVCFDRGSPQPKLDRLYTAREVMAWLGYHSQAAFWKMVRKEGVPTVELATHVVRFPESGLRTWVGRRTVGCGY